MPTDRLEIALVVIAIAVSIQALTTLAVVVAAMVGWHRVRPDLDARYRVLTGQLDELIVQVREALRHANETSAALGRATERASHVMGDAGDVVRNIAHVVTAPRSLVVAGAVSAAGRLIGRWRRR